MGVDKNILGGPITERGRKMSPNSDDGRGSRFSGAQDSSGLEVLGWGVGGGEALGHAPVTGRVGEGGGFRESHHWKIRGNRGLEKDKKR